MKKIILLYSGGEDSTLLLLFAKTFEYQITCLIFDYGQTHSDEIEIAINNCEQLKVSYYVIRISLPIVSKLTTGTPHSFSNVSPWHVPSRNLMFLSMAASYAESHGISTIWLGANSADFENQFLDCSQKWMEQVNSLLMVNCPYKISLEMPLLGMSKELITKLLSHIQTNPLQTFSGYGNTK